MFQQFKNIFPGSTTLNIRSLADSVGLNEDEWRARGMESLEAIRSELQNFNTLLSNKPTTLMNTAGTVKRVPSNNSMDEMAKIVTRIQQGRDSIHQKNLENIEKAKRADQLLGNLLSRCNQHNKICTAMSDMSSSMDATRQDIISATQAASALKNKLLTLEDRIDKACLEYEQREFEVWKQQEKDKMEVEIAEKRQELEARQKHLDQVYEEHNEQQAKKRLELYDVNFQSELEDYRRRRETEVSSLYSNRTSTVKMTTTLENMKLDNGDSADLNSFLSDDDDTNDTTETNIKPLSSTMVNNVDKVFKSKIDVPSQGDQDSSDEDDAAHVEILADEDYESD
ncbi:hypothetical protein BCR42DRAFT_419767 [Absidia repens]|uniref:Uncharacterized protein n=1 Tax=Absidia repens TaxID=90262 RepID=A0A1X2IA77_9FUNG|nr:hypothetical protein BCR42DRAFT_419767 [Absidia repens]